MAGLKSSSGQGRRGRGQGGGPSASWVSPAPGPHWCLEAGLCNQWGLARQDWILNLILSSIVSSSPFLRGAVTLADLFLRLQGWLNPCYSATDWFSWEVAGQVAFGHLGTDRDDTSGTCFGDGDQDSFWGMGRL